MRPGQPGRHVATANEMTGSRRHRWWLTALGVLAVVGGMRAGGLLRPLENYAADARARLLSRVVRSDIVIVGIDSGSLSELDGSPVPRRTHAALIERLSKAGPERVFLDLDLSSPQRDLDDGALEAALRKPRDYPIVVPAFVRHAPGAAGRLIATRPLPRFARYADLASVNGEAGRDGAVREWRNAWDIEGRRVPSIIDPQRRLAADEEVTIDYSISPASFTFLSYVDVLDGRVPREAFAGKDVFVGATAAEIGDILPVPVYRSVPRVVAQALATETVNAGALRKLPAGANYALLALWAGALALALSSGRRWKRNLAVTSLALAGVAVAGIYAFEAERLVLDVAAPMLIAVLLFVAASVRSLKTQTWRALTYSFGVRRRDALLKSVVQSSTDCIICIDEAGIVRTANPAASRLFDCPVYELVDEPIAKFIALLAGDGTGARLSAMHGEVRECDARTHRGEVFPVEISVSRVRLNTERIYTAIVRDIRERRSQQRRLQHQATHDALTGLPNRAALATRLDAALTGKSGGAALMMLDLCRFKEVNDTLGHSVGDRVLCEVAQRFFGALGERGFIARVGGDEFAVLVARAASSETVAHLSQILAESLRGPIDVAGISIEVGVSIGVARFPQDGSDAQSLLRHADVAMYTAKRRGAPFEYYDAAFEQNSARKLAIGGELRAAIANGNIELHFQPQVNLRTGLVESAEALMRWMHPTQGAVSPSEFIAIAEASDLIRSLTEWTLSTALAQVRAWRDRGLHTRIAVNISARILQDTGFPARLALLLESSGVAAASLELEITESAMMVDPARALRVVQEIDRLGVLISIDDFGTGYSSLGFLRDLPVHSLKLDKSFVLGMRSNSDDRTIVESTAQMARALRLELIAEGVETDWDAQFLRAAGYDYAQGFRYAHALPADKCFAWILEHNATAILTINGDMPNFGEKGTGRKNEECEKWGHADFLGKGDRPR